MMKRTIFAVPSRLLGAGILCLLCASSAHAQSAPAAPPERDAVSVAEEHAAQAYEAYENKRYAEAVALYQKAYSVAPAADMLYNIARIYDVGLHDRPLAMTFYRRYAADPGANAERLQKVNERLLELKAAELAMQEAAARSVEPEAAPARPQPSTQEEAVAPSYWTGWRVAGATLGIAGLAGVGAGVAFGLGAMSKADTVDEFCDGNRCTSQRGVDAASEARSRANVATAGFIGGGALLLSGATMLLFDFGDSVERDELAGWQLSPIATGSQLGISFSGRL